VLIACEYSATVRDAFRDRGFDAWSCDLLPTEGDPRWHIQGDALEAIYGQHWDCLIAHPPCTYLTYAGAAYWNKPGRAEQREDALTFFKAIYAAPVHHIAIENPRGYPSKAFRRQDQEVNPFEFGNPVRKRVCLWLKNLPPLMPTEIVEAPPRVTYIRKSGTRAGQPYHGYFHQGKTAKERARFFPCIAAAMADQWGDHIRRAESLAA
jgi:hypothetical protein